MAYTFAIENYNDVEQEASILYEAHRDEVGADKQYFKVAPNSNRYREACRLGISHLVIVRFNGELVGYHMSFVQFHLHYKYSLTAQTDLFYIKPEHRKGSVGIRLFKFVIQTLKARGVQRIYTGTKLKLDIGPMLERLGFKPIERLYSLVIKENCENTS